MWQIINSKQRIYLERKDNGNDDADNSDEDGENVVVLHVESTLWIINSVEREVHD